MYSYFKGEIAEKNADSVVVDCNGVGYLIGVSTRTLSELGAVGEKAKIYTHFHVREGEMTLYGFLSHEEKTMFEKIITVNGIGPKAATSILSTMSVTELAVAIVAEDATAIARAPGVGKKTALRMILELKEKVDNSELTGAYNKMPALQNTSVTQEALAALMALGFSSTEATRAISTAGEHTTVEDLITAALKQKGT
jgi:Holliday junction DNA helicase RuvA